MRKMIIWHHLSDVLVLCYCAAIQMGQALWRLPPRQQQQLQEELADRLADRGGGGREQSKTHI